MSRSWFPTACLKSPAAETGDHPLLVSHSDRPGRKRHILEVNSSMVVQPIACLHEGKWNHFRSERSVLGSAFFHFWGQNLDKYLWGYGPHLRQIKSFLLIMRIEVKLIKSASPLPSYTHDVEGLNCNPSKNSVLYGSSLGQIEQTNKQK